MIITDGIIFKIGWCKLNFTGRNEKTEKKLARAKLAYACRILPHPFMFLANLLRSPLLNFQPLDFPFLVNLTEKGLENTGS